MKVKPLRQLQRVTDQFGYYHERLRKIRADEGRPGLDPLAEALARSPQNESGSE